MPHQQDKPNWMVWIDTAKGIGILLVVFNHLSLYLHLSETYSTIALLDEIMGSIDMPIFLVISGILSKPQGISVKMVLKITYAE